ncbi:hypothetical protein [Mycolicibacterium sp. XJ775]
MAIVRAKEPFSYIDSQGVPRIVSPGQLLDDGDPAVIKRAHLFEPVEVAAARATETATAAPGELRSVAKKAPAKKAAPAADKSGDGGTGA